MIKITANDEPLYMVHPPLSEISDAHHLIVPVTNLDVDPTLVAPRLWDLAQATGADISLVGLCNDPSEEPRLRRALVSLAAMVNYGHISANLEILIGKDWVTAVRSRCQPGDMVVCLAEESAGLLRKPLSQLLQPGLNVPLYVLSGVSHPATTPANAKTQIVAWIGFLAIMLGFLVLQVKIYQLTTNWIATLEIISTAVECWAIWKWNSLFG